MAGKTTEVAKQQTTSAVSTAKVNDKFIEQLIGQVKQKQELGLTFPSDYNPANELTGAYLILKETKDRNNRPVLDTCSPASVATALMMMVNSRLSMLKKQCYPIAYGSQLQMQPSVFGNICNARRYGMTDINAAVIREGDNFLFHYEKGKLVLDEHKSSLANWDKPVIGAYAVASFKDGSEKCEIMTRNQIVMAWKQGYGYKEDGNGTHQKFADQMAIKTVENRLLKKIIRTYGEPEVTEAYEDMDKHQGDDLIAEESKAVISAEANTEEMPDIIDAEVVTVQNADEAPQEAQEAVLPEFMKYE